MSGFENYMSAVRARVDDISKRNARGDRQGYKDAPAQPSRQYPRS